MNIIKIFSLAFLAIFSITMTSAEQNNNIKGYPIGNDPFHIPFQLPYADNNELNSFIFPVWQSIRKADADSVAFFDQKGQLLTTVRELRRIQKQINKAKTTQEKTALIEKKYKLNVIQQEISNQIMKHNGYICEEVVPVYFGKGLKIKGKENTHAIAIGTTNPQICETIKQYYDEIIKFVNESRK